LTSYLRKEVPTERNAHSSLDSSLQKTAKCPTASASDLISYTEVARSQTMDETFEQHAEAAAAMLAADEIELARWRDLLSRPEEPETIDLLLELARVADGRASDCLDGAAAASYREYALVLRRRAEVVEARQEAAELPMFISMIRQLRVNRLIARRPVRSPAIGVFRRRSSRGHRGRRRRRSGARRAGVARGDPSRPRWSARTSRRSVSEPSPSGETAL
jgi:hypothetical protein